jgi:hypothetical protein
MMRSWMSVLNGFAVALCVAFLGCGGDSPFDVDVSDGVDSLAAIAPFPKKQVPLEASLAVGRDITLFTLMYGEPQDCPSGCFYSTAYGLRNGAKIAWLAVDDMDEVNLDDLELYEFDARDSILFTDAGFRAIDALDSYFYHSHFLTRLAASTTVGTGPLVSVAQTLPGWISPYLADVLIANPVVRTSREVLVVLADLPVYNYDDSYGRVRAEAQRLLGKLGG